MKKVVLIFSALLMLGGATVSILKFFELGPFSPVIEEDVVDPNIEKSGMFADKPVTIEMDPLVIPIFSDDQVATTVMIQMNLIVMGDNEDRITKILPRLADAFLRDLYSFIPRVIKRHNKLNAAILRERMKMTAERVAGKSVIKDIEIVAVSER